MGMSGPSLLIESTDSMKERSENESYTKEGQTC